MTYSKYQSKNFILKSLLKNFIRTLNAFISPLKIENILDVGCGKGYVLSEIISTRPDLMTFALDIDEEAVRFCQRIISPTNLFQADITTLPLKKNSIDLLLCLELLEHLRNPTAALLELQKASPKYLVFSVPNQPYFRIGNLLRGKYIRNLGNECVHVNLWTSSEFIEIIRKYFNILKTARPFPWIMLLCKSKNDK